jgi:NAD(P)-dependent dehydrogenase (short-subunit alcohol dehydrogenase family)
MTVTHDFSGRAAVITGGARGIGLAAAQRLHASGAKVSLWDMDATRLAEVAAGFKGGVDTRVVDVTNYASVEAAAKASHAAMGSLDILVNSAGVAGPNHMTWEYPVEEWTKVIDIDLNGTFMCCRAAVPFMRDRNYGRIVNIASIAGKEGNGLALQRREGGGHRLHQVARQGTRQHADHRELHYPGGGPHRDLRPDQPGAY